MKPLDQLSPWELLGLDPGASPDQIRHAYERLVARLAPGSLALYSIADREEQLAVQRRLRIACLELLGDASNLPGEEAPPLAQTISEVGAGSAAPSIGEADEVPAQRSRPEAEFNGNSLRCTREAKGISLEALSHRTRIRRQLLEAVEAERFSELPQRVFVRGFVFAIARELGLNPERVWASYGRRWEAWSAARVAS